MKNCECRVKRKGEKHDMIGLYFIKHHHKLSMPEDVVDVANSSIAHITLASVRSTKDPL